MLSDPSTKFWLGVLVVSAFAIGIMLTVGGTSVRAESNAKAAICRDMAGEVLAGKASRFDYMTTRCSARLLIAAEDV